MNVKLFYHMLRCTVEDPYRRQRFRAAYTELQRAVPEPPSRELLEELRAAWGNRKWSAEAAFLTEVSYLASEAEGPIVECGSGLTTLVLAAYAGPRAEVWALEDNKLFRRRVMTAAELQSATKVHVEHAPIVEYGGYSWYKLPPAIPGEISLVVCDGPPGSGRGGRVGALHVLRSRLAPGFRLLLDDALEEHETVRRWQEQYGVHVQTLEGSRDHYALISAPRPEDGQPG